MHRQTRSLGFPLPSGAVELFDLRGKGNRRTVTHLANAFSDFGVGDFCFHTMYPMQPLGFVKRPFLLSCLQASRVHPWS